MYVESVLKGYRLLPVPENPELRASLEGKSLEELTHILEGYKKLHNSTDVDTAKRAIRAIEIEEYYKQQPPEYREFPSLHSLIVGVNIDRDFRREKITRRLKQRLEEGMVEEIRGLLEGTHPALTPDAKGHRHPIAAEDLIYYGLEYKFVTLYITGELSLEQLRQK